jgi:hypothetical protein
MKRLYPLGALLAGSALALLLATVPGCTQKTTDGTPGKGAGTATGVGSAKGDGEKGDKKGEALVVKATGASLKGKVTYDGKPPERAEIKQMHDHADSKFCLMGPHLDQRWIYDDAGGVANVIVFLEAPAGKFFSADESLVKEHTKDASIDQPHCVFEPHIVAMFPAYRGADNKEHKTGQKLLVKNASDVSHNTKIAGTKGVIFNQNINPKTTKGDEVEIPYQGVKKPLDVGCDKHTWMSAKIVTFDHPFFGVTDEHGNFEIANVPTDAEVTVRLWHEEAGTKDAGKKTFKAGEQASDNYKISAK